MLSGRYAAGRAAFTHTKAGRALIVAAATPLRAPDIQISYTLELMTLLETGAIGIKLALTGRRLGE